MTISGASNAGRFDYFLLYHSAAKVIQTRRDRQLHLWSADPVAIAASDLGLLSWLADRTSDNAGSPPDRRSGGARLAQS